MSTWLDEAVRDNTDWCDLVCRTHGLTPARGEHVWSSSVRTPPFYPDAITLQAGVRADEVLADVDSGPGCSVKDSYADLELGSYGFRLLFAATWLVHCPDPARRVRGGWSVITQRSDFVEWERTWRCDGPVNVLLSSLLEAPEVAVMAQLVDGRVVAGAVAHHTATAVGLSNVFALDASVTTWATLVNDVGWRWQDRPIVAYEHGRDKQLAMDVGFQPIGELRIWLRDT